METPEQYPAFKHVETLVTDLPELLDPDQLRVLKELVAEFRSIKERLESQQWISVDEFKPDEREINSHQNVLFFGSRWQNCYIGQYVNGRFKFDKGQAEHDTITHWMPLPPAPNSHPEQLKEKTKEEEYVYSAHHKPTGEDWLILGIDEEGDRVCAAGWPPSIGKLSDCENLERLRPITEEELTHRRKNFGTNWKNTLKQ